MTLFLFHTGTFHGTLERFECLLLFLSLTFGRKHNSHFEWTPSRHTHVTLHLRINSKSSVV